MAAIEEGRPCSACPWVSRDKDYRAAVSDPATRAAMESGQWFCCHVNMGTCHGARLLHERHVAKAAAREVVA